jgi:hypothetical protein
VLLVLVIHGVRLVGADGLDQLADLSNDGVGSAQGAATYLDRLAQRDGPSEMACGGMKPQTILSVVGGVTVNSVADLRDVVML